ncbi:MAG: hypothetical protein ACI8V2_000313 [Candidatus Latescibacterota bacterium]|jgi:hypothetical protein
MARLITFLSFAIYLELDIEQVKAGLNQIEVTVTDLVSGQAVSKLAIFQLSELK